MKSKPAAGGCLCGAARYEIKVGGRKLVGSAQRRLFYNGSEVVLQHGSILLGPFHRRIVEFLKLGDETRRLWLRQELMEKTTDLRAVLRPTISFNDVADAVRLGFQRSWDIDFDPVAINHHTLVPL